jgi:hypothetical protein
VPGPQTTRDRQGARDSAPRRAAFRYTESVGIPDGICYVAQYLAHRHPCQRFAPHLAMRHALLGADVARSTFHREGFSPSPLAGLPAHLC